MALVYQEYSCVGELVSNFSDSRPRIEERLATAMAAWLAEEIKRLRNSVKESATLPPVAVAEGYSDLADAYTALGDSRSAVDAFCSQLTGMVATAARSAVEDYVNGVLARGDVRVASGRRARRSSAGLASKPGAGLTSTPSVLRLDMDAGVALPIPSAQMLCAPTIRSRRCFSCARHFQDTAALSSALPAHTLLVCGRGHGGPLQRNDSGA